MKKQILVFVILLLAGLSAVNGQKAQKNQSSARRNIISVIDRLADAGIKRDVKIVGEIYSDDYFHTNADGSIMSKADVLKSYQSATDVKIESNTHDEDRIQIDGDTAVFNMRVAYKGSAGGQPFSRLYRVTYVLRKNKKWRVVASHASVITN